MSKRKIVSIPISERARKYGYIIWGKALDEDVRSVLGDVETVDFCGDVTQTGKRIDWAQRRVSITYSVTRGLPQTKKSFEITKKSKGVVKLRFT